jgi:fibronectin-binding autotransporter adhesin
VPYNDDPLTFPASAAIQANVNDLGGPPIPLNRVGLVTFAGSGYNISGGTLYLDAGISNSGTNTWGVYSIMNTAESFTGNGGTLTIGNMLDNGGFNLTVTGSGTTIFTAAITSSGGLTKNGSGTLRLSGSNNYSGTTTINQGTLTVGGTAALYGGSSGSWAPSKITVGSGATLGIGLGNSTSGYFDANAFTLLLNSSHLGASTPTTGLKTGAILGLDTTNAAGGSFTFSGSIANAGSSGGTGLAKLGDGKLILSGTNSYTGGTFVSSGTLVVASPAAIADGTNLTIGTEASSLFAASAVPAADSALAVPEPSTLALFAAAFGCGAIVLRSRRKRVRKKWDDSKRANSGSSDLRMRRASPGDFQGISPVSHGTCE